MTSDEQTEVEAELNFVYNTGSSPLAQAFDLLHKTFSPATYSCNLCRVTYGVFSARKEWTGFIKGLPYRTVFLHKNEFRLRHPSLAATPLPAVFRCEAEETLALLASAKEIDGVRSVEELKTLLLSKLAKSSPAVGVRVAVPSEVSVASAVPCLGERASEPVSS